MLDFFEQQAKAKRRTKLLVAVYLAGVCLFVSLVAPVLMAFVVVGAAAVHGSRHHGQQPDPWDRLAETLFPSPLETFSSPEGRMLWALAAGGTALLVVGAGAWKAAMLRTGGGRVVAESLGGRLVVGGAHDFYDQRLLNVVEEMAIASGSPVPPVYMLDNEDGINAFAAGYSSGDAVVTVTRGTARSLTREQLQGVVAHEFSHVLNGDMRLNIRLVGLLYGIIAVQLLGRVFFEIGRAAGRGRGRDSGKAAILFFVFGLVLLALGATGAAVARVVKAMIGREREYLADASAAQFTRNPEGLAAALRVVGGADDGGMIQASGADEYSHLYFVEGVSEWFGGLTNTHPPLPKRIRRLDPSWDGSWLPPTGERAKQSASVGGGVGARAMGLVGSIPLAERSGVSVGPASRGRSVPLAEAVMHLGGLTPEEVFARVGAARRVLDALPAALLDAARDPHDARALVLALLLDQPDGARNSQLQLIEQQLDSTVAGSVSRLESVLHGLPAGARTPLLEVSLSALASLSPDQYRKFRGVIEAEIGANRRVSLFQTCVQRMLMVHLDRRFGLAKPPVVQYYALTRLGEECSVLLSTATIVAGQGREEALANVTDQCRRLGTADSRLQESSDITPVRLHGALSTLATASARLRVQIVRACAEIIGQDGKVTPSEAELLRAVADGLDVPVALPAGT